MANPNEYFAVISVTRAEIAAILMEFIDEFELEAVITKDDDRLTDNVCKRFAGFQEYISRVQEDKSDEELDDIEYSSNVTILEMMGVDISSLDSE